MNAVNELRAYAYLLELNVDDRMKVIGLRLGELANEIAKDLQQASQQTPEPPPITYGPRAVAANLLLVELADWWDKINTKHLATQPIYDELRDLTRRAFNIVRQP